MKIGEPLDRRPHVAALGAASYFIEHQDERIAALELALSRRDELLREAQEAVKFDDSDLYERIQAELGKEEG